jgi:hypothetical protein
MKSFSNILFRAALPAAFAIFVFGGTASAQLVASADQPALASYVLSMDNLRRATEVSRGINELRKTLPSLPGEMQSQQTLDGKAKYLEGKPQVAALLKKSGLSARDYVLTNQVLVRAAVFSQLPSSPDAQQGVQMLAEQMGKPSKQQLDFFTKHKPEIDLLMRPAPPAAAKH